MWNAIKNMMPKTLDQWKSFLRSSGQIGSGMLFMLGVVSAKQKGEVIALFTQLSDQLDVIVIGGSTASAFAIALYGIFKASPDQQQASVAERPDRVVVPVNPEKQAEAALAIARVPEALAIITTTAVADATPQVAKIVAPDSPRATA